MGFMKYAPKALSQPLYYVVDSGIMGFEENISFMGYNPDGEEAEVSFQKDMDGKQVSILLGVSHVAEVDMETFKDACKRIQEIW